MLVAEMEPQVSGAEMLWEDWKHIVGRETRLYLKYRPWLQREQEDYLQQASLALWQVIKTSTVEIDELVLELLRKAVRDGLQQLDESTRQFLGSRPLHETQPCQHPTPDQQVQMDEKSSLLHNALDELQHEMPDPYSLIWDVYFRQQTLTEAAASRELGQRTAAEIRDRGLRRLRDQLVSLDEESGVCSEGCS